MPLVAQTAAVVETAGCMSAARSPVALLYPGDRAMRDRADPAESRFAALFEAFAAAGIAPSPAVYHDDFADEVAAQLRDVDARAGLVQPDRGRPPARPARRVAARGRRRAASFVSAHPDAILQLGTKDVLVETRDLPFGSDVHRIDSLEQLEAELPRAPARAARACSSSTAATAASASGVSSCAERDADRRRCACATRSAAARKRRSTSPALLRRDGAVLRAGATAAT